MLLVLRERAGDQGESAERLADISRLVGRKGHAAVLVAEGTDDAAARGELRVRLEATEEFARRATDAGHGSGGVALALEEVLHRGDRLGDFAEIKLRQAHRTREGVRTVVDGRLEGQLAAAAERAFRKPAGKLAHAQTVRLRIGADDESLGLDAVSLRGADRDFQRAGMASPERCPVRRRRRRGRLGDDLLRLREQREHVVDVDVIDRDLGLPVGLRPGDALREGELAGAGVRGLQAEAALGVEPVRLGRITSRDGRLRDAPFALAEADVADFQGDFDLAVLGSVRAGAVTAAGDDAQGACERLFG